MEKKFDGFPAEVVSQLALYETALANRTENRESPTSELEHIGDLISALTILCTHPSMKSVWRRLSKREKIPLETRGSENPAAYAYSQFSGAVLAGLYDRSQWDYLSPADRVKEAGEITQQLLELSSRLDRFNLGKDIFEGFKDEELNGAQLYFRGVGIISPEELLVEMKNLHTLPESGITTYKYAPSLPELLSRYAVTLKDNPPHKTAKLSQPKRKKSDLTFFVRTLEEHNRKRYEMGLYGIVADTAALFFDDDITEDSIRFMLTRN